MSIKVLMPVLRIKCHLVRLGKSPKKWFHRQSHVNGTSVASVNSQTGTGESFVKHTPGLNNLAGFGRYFRCNLDVKAELIEAANQRVSGSFRVNPVEIAGPLLPV